MIQFTPLSSSERDDTCQEHQTLRDGTSQEHRTLTALQADYVVLDEHSLKDQLALANTFAKELNYFSDDNIAAGDWQGLLNPENLEGQDFDAWLQQITDFIEQPDNFFNDDANLRRPHFVLYLTFLQLLKNTQGQLKQLTPRHLDFYYRQVLNFNLKPSQPDCVNVLIAAATSINSVFLPKGTLLSAGKDSINKELVYQTDTDLLVNSAKIARLSSVFVNQQIIGIGEAHEQYSGTKNDAVMAMLNMALGQPLPSDALALYPPKKTVDFTFLTQLQTLVKFVDSGLYLELEELRSLIKFKNNRGTAADKDWETINTILSGPIKNQNEKSLSLTGTLRDFDNNIKAVLGFESLETYFSTLSSAKNFTQLYELRTSSKVIEFMRTNNLSVNRFNEMMQIKVRIDNEWQEIKDLLARAGQKRSAGYTLPIIEPPDFDVLFNSALGKPSYPVITGIAKIKDLDSFYQTLLDIEAYFFMPLEDFLLLMSAATAIDSTNNAAWANVYALLAVAYQKKVFATHKTQLNQLRLDKTTTDARKLAVQSMMQLALDRPVGDNSDLLGRIQALLPKNTDMTLLEKAIKGDALTEKDSDSVCNTLELAWRNRVPVPVAQKTNWLSLCAYSDTLTANVPDTDRRYTFGQRQTQLITDQTQPPVPTLGWAISSPMLCLAQGQRTITLTLGFKPEAFNTEKITALLGHSQLFKIDVSTAKGWLAATNISVSMGVYPNSSATPPLKSLCLTFSFDERTPALCLFPTTDNTGIKTLWPQLRLILQPRWDDDSKNYLTDYPLFQSLLLEKVQLAVSVNGLSELMMQNDNGTLAAGKPFEPFGMSPTIGSRWYFSHPELVLKRLDTLAINVQWLGVPADNLGGTGYYSNYPAMITADNSAFKSQITLVDQRFELPLADAASLFNATNATQSNRLSIADISAKIPSNYHYERLLSAHNPDEVTTGPRYYFLELAACDFQHGAYSAVAAAKSIELASAIAKQQTITPSAYQVNPPYTPKLKSVSINYTASLELSLAELQEADVDQLFHLHPFGYAPLQSAVQQGGYPFLPAYANEGELYIGLSDVQAPQTVSILLQMAEGTANPDVAVANVHWSVLSDNRWLALDKGQVQSDASNGLLQSGIINLQLDAVIPSTVLPSELYWLRVAIAQGCDGVCDSVDMDTQAVSATFINQDNADDHLNQPLAVDTLKKLVAPLANITGVRQPFTSFKGETKEQEAHFNTRVSERLRHKHRAVSVWDYERLVLEQFPELYKVKAIPAQSSDNPGQVTVVVIPDIRNRLPFNPFEPKAPASLLADIKTFLSAHTALGADISVKNARYVPVTLRFAVRFRPGYDSGFYVQQLNEEVNRFLSPWAYEQGKDLVIGGKIYANAIIDFIERQFYVDYVAHFKLFLGTDLKFVPLPPLNDSCEGYCVTADRPDAVLVAAKTHVIDLITEINFGEQSFSGINYMKLELDLIIG